MGILLYLEVAVYYLYHTSWLSNTYHFAYRLQLLAIHVLLQEQEQRTSYEQSQMCYLHMEASLLCSHS